MDFRHNDIGCKAFTPSFAGGHGWLLLNVCSRPGWKMHYTGDSIQRCESGTQLNRLLLGTLLERQRRCGF